MPQENAPYNYPDGREYRQEENGRYSVLDHGYLDVIRAWGSDQEIIESARMSTDKGFLGWGPMCSHGCTFEHCSREHAPDEKLKAGDEGLLRYLYEHKHSTPFEFAGLTIEVQAPIMVFREWHRHRTQSYSEMSARYVQMPNLHYVPSVERIIASAKKSSNKQASGGGVLSLNAWQSEEEQAKMIRGYISGEQQRVYSMYEQLLAFGVSKEIARLNTPVSRYSRMRATGNLRNWLAFLTLRMAPDAQFEIRQFAWCVASVVKEQFPRTYALFNEGVKPILDPGSVDTPEKAFARGATVMRQAFHTHGKLEENDPLWEITIPEYQRSES